MTTRPMIEMLCLILSGTSVLYWGLAGRWLRQWREEIPSPANATPLPPVTFFRPLKPGVPRLREKLIALVNATQPGDQILLGVTPESVEARVAEEVRGDFPAVDIAVLFCTPDAALNPKISKLRQMEKAARHEHWLVSDSEAVLDAAGLARFRAEWQSCAVLTAGYRLTGLAGWPQRLDAAAVLLTLWPGLAAVRRWSRPRFTLGACTGVRRDDLASSGGWAALGGLLAEDHALGAALAAAGKRIVISQQIVSLEADPLTWWEYWRHQRRVALTYRVTNPAGCAGMILTHGLSWSLAAVALAPGNVGTWLTLATVWAVRWWTARRAATALGFEITGLAGVVLIAGWVETGCWLLAWGTRQVWWSGRWRAVDARGRLAA